MPAGLDGNPDPVRTRERDAVLAAVVDRIVENRQPGRPCLVGIDGQGGSGKSTFADEIAHRLTNADAGARVVRSTTDSFHHPRDLRYRRGRASAEGYYHDSFDLDTLRRLLLDPMRAGAGFFRPAAFDEPSDSPVDAPEEPVDPNTVLVFDGLFLQRPELRGYWDVSVFLDRGATERESVLGWAARESGACGPEAAFRFVRLCGFMHRYWDGWRLYERECTPRELASMVIDNSKLEHPRVVTNRGRRR